MELHPLELKERLDAKHDLYLLDVRTINETDICLIPGSHIIPLHELADRTSEIPKDKDVIVICHHGQRSFMAMQYLRDRGFPAVFNLQGGVDSWAANVDPEMPRY